MLVGNGMAGVRVLEELLEAAPGLYDIAVFGAEPHGNYNRILLSPVLAGEKQIGDIMLNDEAWYKNHGIRLHKGKEVTRIDRHARRVIAADGTEEAYDRLLLATGSTPVILPVPGHDLPGVIGFRDIKDVESMVAASKQCRHAVVIGGGLLGLEAANGLKQLGMLVTVVHLLPTLMERQLDAQASNLLLESLKARGIDFLLGTETRDIIGKKHAQGVRFKDGREISADLVVMAVGIRPNISLAKDAGLYCERGVVVNDTLQTYDPRVYAVGECVQHRKQTYGLVAPLFEQAKVCANHLARIGFRRYQGSLTSTRLKVTGIDVFSAGDFTGDATTESIVLADKAAGMYKKLVIKDNRIHGAIMIGDTVDGPWYFQMMRSGQSIADIRPMLLYGQAHLGDAGHGGAIAVTTMGDNIEVCGCNGVSKGTIVKAISAKGLFTLEDVRLHTKASSSCGSCTGLVEQILAATLGGDYSAAPKEKPLCGCTEHAHDEVRAVIRDNFFATVGEAQQFMGWKNKDGCHKCRPALNYYLICAWPGRYVDDRFSRFINERAHANIQKDGTYSVIPRIFGGETNPAQLRAIADVAEKYQVRTVKITGGQRIDLLWLKKEQLPLIWGDLAAAGFVSGHAYGKAIRTVKTCIGNEWCRFGVQDSTRMGIEIEKLTWGAWTPHKVKMAASGCPRNCAEASIKDFGVVAVDSGWEIHIGGNGGVKVRVTDLLCKVATSDEVLEYCAAFLQLYREEAHYLERTAPWVERVGLSYVKRRLVEDEAGRKELTARFKHAQQFYQVDPWAERAQGVDHAEFAPIRAIG